MISVRKKRLKKKAKAPKRKNGAEALSQEDSSREEYVRINQVNVFDYQQQL